MKDIFYISSIIKFVNRKNKTPYFYGVTNGAGYCKLAIVNIYIFLVQSINYLTIIKINIYLFTSW